MTSSDEIFALVAAWAKAKHPEKYDATLKVARNPETFRKYLVRLVEIRCEEDLAFIRDVPLSVLDETHIVKRFAIPPGWGDKREFKIGGRLAKEECDLRFTMLNASKEEFGLLVAAVQHLDMAVVRE